MISPIRLSFAMKILLGVWVGGFVIQQTWDQFFGGHILEMFALVPAAFVFEFKIWQIVTYAFLHADVPHLFLNLLMFVFLGGELEAVWGTRKWLLFLLTSTLGGGLFYLLLQVAFGGGLSLRVPMVGASGAIYGLLTAYGVLFAERQMLFMMLFPLKAKHFVWILGAVEFFTVLFSGRSGLAAAAHLGGMGAALFSMWVETRIRLFRASQEAKAALNRVTQNHLRLVVNNKNRDASRGGDRPRTWN